MNPLRELHEIELSSRCNLACKYCPHPTMTRPKVDMTFKTFGRVLDVLGHFCRVKTQTEVSLTGIGEALLHPDFIPMLKLVRHTIGPTRRLVLSTNGIEVTMKNAAALKENDVLVFVSLHRPELAKPALDMLREVGVTAHFNYAFAADAIDWAGQVKVDAPMMHRRPCDYLARGWGVVRVDGAITTCCMDAHNLHTFGTVFDDPASLQVLPHGLCNSCNLSVPDRLLLGKEAVL